MTRQPRFRRAIALAAALLLIASAEQSFAITFTTIDDPLATGGFTSAEGISGSSIVGYYIDASQTSQGFLYNGSTYTTIDDPLASPTRGSAAHGISSGNIVGSYSDSSGRSHGFLYNGSTYTTLDNPLAAPLPFAGTFAYGISGSNIVGTYATSTGVHGFLYNGSTYTTLDVPFAGEQGTFPFGISGSNIVGHYNDSSNRPHGFLYNGLTYTTLDDPLAGSSGTSATGISGSNIVGYYYDSSSVAHGFIYDGLNYTTLDDPLGDRSFINGLDGNNIVGGYVVDASGDALFATDHGFVATVPEPSSLALAVLGVLVLMIAFTGDPRLALFRPRQQTGGVQINCNMSRIAGPAPVMFRLFDLWTASVVASVAAPRTVFSGILGHSKPSDDLMKRNPLLRRANNRTIRSAGSLSSCRSRRLFYGLSFGPRKRDELATSEGEELMYRSHHLNLGLPSFRVTTLLAVAFVLVGLRPAAAESTWTGLAFAGAWNNANNWSPSGAPNSASAAVNFSGNQIGTVNISLSVVAQSLLFSNPAGNYTLTSSAAQTLSGVSAITVGAAVTGVESINLANIATGSLLFLNDLTITNNSTAAGTTIVIGPSTVIGTPSSGTLVVTGAGTTQISGSFAASPNAPVGGLVKNGPGTLVLSRVLPETYTGGTIINGGTLSLGTGNEIPTGSNVTVNGGQFNIGSGGNSATTAIGTLSVSPGGTFLVPSGSSDYHLNQLVMTGGTVDFSGTSAFFLHLHDMGVIYAAITTAASSTTATWIGSANSHIQNDTASPLTITVNQGTTPSGIDLDAGIALSNNGGSGFVKAGPGTMRLTNTANTANFIINQGALRVDDMAALGSGTVSTGGIGGVLQYGGPTATSPKNINLGTGATGTIQVLTDGANLTLNGVITGANQNLAVVGTFINGTSSRLTLNNLNTYTGSTTVDGNGVLAIPEINYGGFVSSIGSSSSAAANLVLGSTGYRGTLLYTGPQGATDRGATLIGAYPAGGAIGVEGANGSLTWEGRFTGTGNLIKTGAGTLHLQSQQSTYFTGTYIEAGTLEVDGDVNIPGAVIPANTNVTVFSGGKFQIGPAVDNQGVPIGTLALTGGTMSLRTMITSRYYLNKLAMTGGVVDLSETDGNGFDLYFTGAAAAITTNASSTTATWIGDAGAEFKNSTLNPLPIIVAAGSTANGIDLDAGIRMSLGSNPAFIKAGAGTMRLTSQFNQADFIVQKGALRVDDLTNGVGPLGFGALTLSGGRLAYGGSDATLSKAFTVDTAGGTIDVLSATTMLTVTSPIVTNGVLTKSGPGILVLNNLANLYDSGLVVSGGRLDVGNDSQLGVANPTVNAAGTLRYTAAATTSRTFNLTGGTLEAPAGVTLTLDGATVNGGVLRGPGLFTISGNTSVFGATTLNNTTINQTGSASVTNFTNGGTFTNSAGQVLSVNGGANTSSGNFTINGSANVSNWSSNGVMTINGGGALNNSGSNLVLGGGSRTTINSSATLATAASTTIELNGGLLENNGTITGTTNVNFGSLAKGTGLYGVVNVDQGGIYSPGNSPGIVTAAAVNFDNTAVNTGAPVLQIELAGIAPGTQYDQLHVTGQLSLGGTLQVSLLNAFAPAAGNTFNILDWGTLSGTFAALQLPTLTGSLSWNTSQLYTTGVLSVANGSIPPGDFNRDGHVNAADLPAMLVALADLNAYQSTRGLSAANLLAISDIDGDGKVTNADMQALLNLLKNGGGSVAPVPEPSSIALLALALPGLAFSVIRRRGGKWGATCRGVNERRAIEVGLRHLLMRELDNPKIHRFRVAWRFPATRTIDGTLWKCREPNCLQGLTLRGHRKPRGQFLWRCSIFGSQQIAPVARKRHWSTPNIFVFNSLCQVYPTSGV